MSVRKRSWTTRTGETKEAWVVDYVDQLGTRRLKTFARKKEADAFKDATGVQVREGTHVADSASVTVKEAGERWITSGRADQLERTTVDQRRQHLDLHIVPFIGRIRLSQLTIATVKDFRDKLRQGEKALPAEDPRNAPRSADMVKRVLVSLGSLLADAMDSGLAARNPVQELSRRGRRGKVAQGERRRKVLLQVGVDIPTPGEVAALIQSAKGRWRPLIITAVYTGMRSSELRGLRWSDVDLKSGRVHVRQRADRYREIGLPKSEAGQRSIPVGPFVVNTLKEWKLACPKGELDLVFPNGNGNVEDHLNILRRGLIPTLIAAGVSVETGTKDEDGKPTLEAKYSGLHALRHFFASWCINREEDGGRGLPPKTVQHLLGHSSITMTMDVYGHLFPTADDREALAAAERRLLAAVNAT
jgi:integrase